MPKLFKDGSVVDWREMLPLGLVHGGFVTPGAGVNVNVAALYGALGSVEFEKSGATNLTVTAGAQAAEDVVNNIVVTAATGAITAVAGVSAPTGTAAAPALAAGTVLLATVMVANGASGIVQADISNLVRNFL